ncbi:MAG TPA: hypothetical protein VJB18_06610 [Burkholderiales bacterium]|nr:hypothetical protein [Burkholderiales bacterium]
MRRMAIAVLLVAGLFGGAALAESRFAENGVLRHVNLRDGTIVVEDGQLWLGPATRVYTPTGSLGSLQMLRPGQMIQFNMDKTAKNRRTVSEIWIVPGN